MGSCDVRVCRICFGTNCQLHLLHENMELYKGYEAVTGLVLADEEDLPPYLCTDCVERLMICAQFRHRSLRAHFILLDVLKNHGRISVESIQAVIRTTHGDTNIERTEEENTLGDVKIEIECEDITANRIAAQLRDEIKAECMADDVGVDDDTVGEEAMAAPCDVETSGIKKEYDEASVIDVDDSKLRTGEDALDDGPLRQEDKWNTVVVKEETEVMNNFNQTEGMEVNEKPIQNVTLSSDLYCYENYSETQFLSNSRAHTESTHCKTSEYKMKKKTKTPHSTVNVPHTCGTCGQSFSTKKRLTDHLRSHLGKDFSCDICKKSYRTKSDLKIHMWTHSSNKPYSCEICQRSYARKDTLRHHVLTHSAEKPYSCDVCSKSYRSKNHVKRHKLIHSTVKPFSCNICEKSFLRRHHFNNHMVIHSSEKPYKCDACETSFNDKSNLKRHRLLHITDKQYYCDVCKRSYRWQSAFKRHMLIHSGIKPYTCDICKKTLTQKSYLICHLRIHSGDRPHACELCEKSFRTKTILQRHVMRVHTVRAVSQ